MTPRPPHHPVRTGGPSNRYLARASYCTANVHLTPPEEQQDGGVESICTCGESAGFLKLEAFAKKVGSTWRANSPDLNFEFTTYEAAAGFYLTTLSERHKTTPLPMPRDKWNSDGTPADHTYFLTKDRAWSTVSQ